MRVNLTLGLFLLLGAWQSVPGWVRPAAGATIAVVWSGQTDAYQEALQGFQKAALFRYMVFPLGNAAGTASEVAQKISAGAFNANVILGSEALTVVKYLPAGTSVVYTMVLEPLELQGYPSSGIVIKIDLADQFASLVKLFPGKRRVGIIYNPRMSGKDVASARTLGPKYGLDIFPIAIENREELVGALTKMTTRNVDFLWMPIDPILALPQSVSELVQHCLKENLYLIGFSKYHVKAGALLAFSADYYDVGAQTANYVQRLLAGKTKPQVEYPRKVVIYVNSILVQKLKVGDLSKFPNVQLIQ